MQNKIIKLLVIFILLFSLRGFSQTPEQSAHPLLDKYYPQKQVDTSKAVTQIKPAPVATTTAPPPLTTTTVAAPVTPTAIPAETTTTTSAVTTTGAPPVTAATTIGKPATVVVQPPVQKAQAMPAPPLDMRLGSSTKQYDTWEKNNNGAGSVTTSPK